MKHIITPEEIGMLARPCTADKSLAERLIAEAEREDIRPRLGDALFLKVTADEPAVGYDTLINGGEWTDRRGMQRYLQGLKTAVAYYAYARVVRDGNIQATRYGAVIKQDENSGESEKSERMRHYREAFSAADGVLSEVLNYLDENRETFLEYRSRTMVNNRTKMRVIGSGPCSTPKKSGGHTVIMQAPPHITADHEGNIYFEGQFLTDILPRTANEATAAANNAAKKAEAAAALAEKNAGTALAAADEAKRIAEEADAIAKEAARVAGEASATNEQVKQAETARVQAETARVNAENLRATAETARVEAEKLRVTAETARVEAEKLRVAAEQTRAQAETARVSAEQKRVQAESARVQAETKRQEDTATAISAANSATEKANTAAENAEKVVTDALLKTEQTLTAEEQAQVKKNLGIEDGGSSDAVLYTPQDLTDEQKTQAQSNVGVKTLVDFTGVGEKRSESFVAWKNAFRGTSGSITDNASYRISQPVQVKFGDIIDFEMTGGAGISVLSEVLNDDAHTFVRSIFAGGKSQYRYIADKDMYVEFSGATASFVKAYSIQSASIANNLPAYKTPAGGYNRALFEAAGAVYDEETGLWSLYPEYGGLSDITDKEMTDIYITNNFLAALNNENVFSRRTFRTNIPPVSIYSTNSLFYNLRGAFRECTNLEVVFLVTPQQINQPAYAIYAKQGIRTLFMGCTNLRKVLGIISVTNTTSYEDNRLAFAECKKLEYVMIKGLKTDIDFRPTPLIQYDCVKFLIDNAQNTSAITIKVHATTYGYLTGTAEPTEQVGGTTDEWQALVTAATEKQISFASA